MMYPPRLAFFASLGLLLSLAACGDDDVKIPKVFGSEVPPEVLAEPRPVPALPPQIDNKDWPLLGAVPARPKDFTPQPTIDAAKSEMQQDRANAERLQQNYQAAPPVKPEQ